MNKKTPQQPDKKAETFKHILQDQKKIDPQTKRVYIPHFELDENKNVVRAYIEQTDIKTKMVKKVYTMETRHIAVALSQFCRFFSHLLQAKSVNNYVSSLFRKEQTEKTSETIDENDNRHKVMQLQDHIGLQGKAPEEV